MKKDYKGPRLIHPPNVTKDLTPLEVEHARSLYFGLLSMVDAWARQAACESGDAGSDEEHDHYAHG